MSHTVKSERTETMSASKFTVSQLLKDCLKCGLSTRSEEELLKLFKREMSSKSFPTEQREMEQGHRLLEAMLNPVLKLHRVTGRPIVDLF